jgi:hypothetical protein
MYLKENFIWSMQGMQTLPILLRPIEMLGIICRNKLEVARGHKLRKELFNLRHAQLRNHVEHIIGVIQNCFPILKCASQHPIESQAEIVIACPYAAKSRNQTARDEIVKDYRPFLGEEPFFGDERLLPAPDSPCFSMAMTSDRRRKRSSDEIREEVERKIYTLMLPLLIKKEVQTGFFYTPKNLWFHTLKKTRAAKSPCAALLARRRLSPPPRQGRSPGRASSSSLEISRSFCSVTREVTRAMRAAGMCRSRCPCGATSTSRR